MPRRFIQFGQQFLVDVAQPGELHAAVSLAVVLIFDELGVNGAGLQLINGRFQHVQGHPQRSHALLVQAGTPESVNSDN